MSAVILKGFKKKQLQALVDEIGSANSSYYFVLSKPTDWPGANDTPSTPFDTEEEKYDFRREIISGKKIKSTDAAFLIRRINWESGTQYAQYTDDDSSLYTKNFFVINSTGRVYKCLYNNNSANSTVEPVETTTNTFETADGYIWKYMYTLTTDANTKFSSSDYIPVVVNTDITTAAVNGSIDVLVINNAGNNYITVADGDIIQNLGNSTISTTFRIQDANTNSANGFYNQAGFYIYYGSGVGQLSQISSYVSNSTGKFVTTTDNLTDIDTTSKFRISPYIRITGDGTNATAICTVDNNYTISTVSILNRGQNYSYANAAIVANSSYGSGANVNVAMPPLGGHGSNPVEELGGSDLAISIQHVGSESNTIPTEVEFRKVGILVDPENYSNSDIYTGNTFTGMHVFEIATSTLGFPKNEVMTSDSATKSGSIIAAYSNTSIIKTVGFEGEFDVFTFSEDFPGNISISGNTITGNGTAFETSSNGYNFEVSDLISFNSGSLWYVYRVSDVISNTEIRVTEADGITAVNSSISNTAMTYQKYTSDRLLPSTVDGYAFILDINNPDINRFTGDLIYYNYVEPTQRSNTSVELTKLILKV